MGRRPKVTSEEVLKAAREAFSERGFEGTTLTSIAARLDISPAAVLRHAPTKEALFAACMAAQPGEIRVPMEFLAEVSGTADPRQVLRRIAESFVPFAEGKLDEHLARFMRSKAEAGTAFGLFLPFDPEARPTPPQRGLALVADYFRRATAAGKLAVPDPEAAALMFMGSLHSYVFLHRVFRIADPPMPLERYLDTLLDVWCHGARPRRARPDRGAAR